VVNNGFVSFPSCDTILLISHQAYLYGATPDRKLAVARAALTGFLGSLEDKGIYEYYVNNCMCLHLCVLILKAKSRIGLQHGPRLPLPPVIPGYPSRTPVLSRARSTGRRSGRSVFFILNFQVLKIS
jgi:hypothetical protein